MTHTHTPTRSDDSPTDRPATDRPETDEPTLSSPDPDPDTGSDTGPDTGSGSRGDGAPMTFSPTSTATMGQFETEAREQSR